MPGPYSHSDMIDQINGVLNNPNAKPLVNEINTVRQRLTSIINSTPRADLPRLYAAGTGWVLDPQMKALYQMPYKDARNFEYNNNLIRNSSRLREQGLRGLMASPEYDMLRYPLAELARRRKVREEEENRKRYQEYVTRQRLIQTNERRAIIEKKKNNSYVHNSIPTFQRRLQGRMKSNSPVGHGNYDFFENILQRSDSIWL